jgi:hypothetical protein
MILRPRETRFSDLMKPRTLWPECQVSCLEETWRHPYGAWWWQHHDVEMFFSGRDWETSPRLRERWTEKSRDPWWNPAQNFRLGLRFTFQQDNNPKHTAKTMQEELQDKSLLSLSGLDPDWTSLERPENSCAELVRIYREELPKYRCAKLVVSHPRRLEV